MFGSKKGVSLLYVLMALVCVGAMGSLVLSMAKKEAGDSSLRTSSELARFSATAGLTYATADFFTNSANANKVIDILNNWDYTDNSKNDGRRWVVRGEGEKEFKEIDIDDDGKYDMKFRVKIVNIDASELKQVTQRNESGSIVQISNPDNSFFVVMLESESIDKSGSRAKNTGFYKITGFELDIQTVKAEMQALYLGGGNMWIHCPITVNGDTYIGNYGNSSNALYHTGGTSASEPYSNYNGKFRLYQSDDAPSSQLSYENFKGPAYFKGGKVMFIRPDINFAQGFGGSAEFQLYDQGNVNVAANSKVIMSNKLTNANDSLKIIFEENCKLIYNKNKQTPSNYPEKFWRNIEDKDIDNTKIDISDDFILDNLGMSRAEPPAFKIKLSNDIINKAMSITSLQYHHTLDGNALNNLYDNNPKNRYKNPKDGKEWLVLQTESQNFGGTTGAFNKRAIIIHKGQGGNQIPNVDMNSGNILFYLPENNELGLGISGAAAVVNYSQLQGTFRGMFYNSSPDTEINLAAGTGGWKVKGAFYNIGSPNGSNKSIQFGVGSVNRITFEYDEAALQEFIDLGILEPVRYTPPPDNNRIDIIPTSIYPKGKSVLLSRSF